jgi:hypothetical protein
MERDIWQAENGVEILYQYGMKELGCVCVVDSAVVLRLVLSNMVMNVRVYSWLAKS